MLYNVVVNDWGETTYVPTALGNVLLVVVLIALLAVAVVLSRELRPGRLTTVTGKWLTVS